MNLNKHDNFIYQVRQTFRSWKEEIQQTFPSLRISIGDAFNHRLRQNTLNITALLKQDDPDEPEAIEFVVMVTERENESFLNADLIWSDGSGRVEMFFADSETALIKEVIDEFWTALPIFQKGLVAAIRRGRPLESSAITGLLKKQ